MNPVSAMAVETTRRAARAVAENLKAMPADKQTWRPLDAGRSALSLVQECAVMNGYFATIIRDRKAPEWNWDAYTAACAKLDTAEKAIEGLQAATEELCAEIQAVPESDLECRVNLPFAEGFSATLREIFFFPYWNMTYHQGQLAYIQTLYGDMEMHGMD